jgi:hypothetical protein
MHYSRGQEKLLEKRLTIFLANIRHPTALHMLTLCLKPSDIRDATCHSNCTFFTVIWISLQVTLDRSVRRIGGDFTKISPPQENANNGSGVQQCLPTTVGNLKLQLNTRGKQL